MVSATLGGATASQPLALRPIGLSSLAFKPTSAIGGVLSPVSGTVQLECRAGPGPITVDLVADKPEAAHPVAPSIVVSAGLQSASFDIITEQVYVKTSAPISATANGVRKTKALTVLPWASVDPATALKFGGVVTGTTSATLSALLTNKGPNAFSVNGIAVTGTGASWFAHTHDCPGSLEPGSTCSIDVTFTPLSATSRSAKLSIATSATAAPLTVSLSGTGLPPP
jgi:hypothetical protein